MNTFVISLSGVALLSGAALGSVYFDPIGDIATGNPNLDIAMVEITDDGVDLRISLTLADLADDWGKYILFINADNGSGSPDNHNPWERNVSGTGGTDMFMGSWVDGAPGSLLYDWNASSSGWDNSAAVVITEVDFDNDMITWTLSGVAAAMIADGYDGFGFEIGTTGGNNGDPAIDLIGEETVQGGWGQPSHSIDFLDYTFSTVPAPAALALLGLAGLARRRRRG
jgi:MYXO-CTERM domain-containing protein